MQFIVCLPVLQFYRGYFSATASIFLPPQGDFLYDNVLDIIETKSEVVSNFPDPMCNNCVVYIVTYSTGAILDGVNQESWCVL